MSSPTTTTPPPRHRARVSARGVAGQANGRTLGGDEGHARADVDVTVVDLAKSGATPEEIHLADQHPVAARRDADDLGEMADEVRALHTAGEGDRRARRGHARAVV